MVAINELIAGVNIALGSAAVSTCASFDANASGAVEINELVAAVGAALEGCPAAVCTPQAGGRCVEITPGPDAQDALLAALIEAHPKDTIFLHAGTYMLDQQLSLQVDDVTLRGEGQDTTILSFGGQTSGGEGLLVQADGFTAEDIGFEDSPGDLLKVEGGVGVTLRRVRAEWTRGPSVENGAYGLYPVQCKDVLIEDSVVRGASGADVYENIASLNTAQFFGLPAPTDPDFDPFSESIYILDNTYSGGGTAPDLGDLTDALVGLVGGLPVPQIAYDGDVDPAKLVDGTLPEALRTCVQDDGGTFVNLNIPAIVAGTPMVSKDPTPFDCSLARLAPVSIPGVP